jgi:hypothetical protein
MELATIWSNRKVQASILWRPAGLVFEASKDPCKFCDLTGLCRVRVEAV